MIDPKNYNHKLYEIAIEGKSGNWVLSKETMSSYEIWPTYSVENGGCYLDCFTAPYPYVSLECKNSDGGMMTDLPIEQESYQPSVEEAYGRVLMLGLGLGYLPVMLKDKIESGKVQHVDVVEIETPVIELVKPYLLSCIGPDRIKVIPGDAWDYIRNTQEKYDFIFSDIWLYMIESYIQGLNMKPIAERCLNPGGIYRYWMQEIKLSSKRYGHKPSYDVPCKTCGKVPHSNLWGGLCAECAPTYEKFSSKFKDLSKNELSSIKEFTTQITQLGYKDLTTTLPDGGIPDVILEGSDGKILVEAKLDLLTRPRLSGLSEEVLRRYDKFGKVYNHLHIILFGDVRYELVIELSSFVEAHCKGWVSIALRGDIK